MFSKCLQIHQLRQHSVQFRRFITANQAAIALRPFYFLVHPDRFAQTPEVATKNEKSLQIFNGYLNELISKSSGSQRQPTVKVNFSILDKNDQFEDITLVLTGDPIALIKETLKKCNLSVKNLPEGAEIKRTLCSAQPSTSSSSKWPTPEDLWSDLRMKDTLKRGTFKRSHYTSGQSLLNDLVNNRDLALKRYKNYKRTNDLVEDEIEFVKRQTGSKSISWAMPWSEIYYLQSLKNLQLLIKQADTNAQKIINNALNGHSLIFGRSSFICVDGSIQFGADDVPETWLSICRESGVRRFEIINVVRLVERVRELLGYANIKISEKSNLLQTTQQLQSLIVRLSSQPKADREYVAALGRETFVQISNSYSSLVMFADGHIQIPCNVNGRTLIEFLEKHSQKSRQLYNNMLHRQSKLHELKQICINELKLADLNWEPNIPTESLYDCMKRLKGVDEAIRNQIQGLRIKVTSSSNFHIMADGTASLPCNFN